MAARTLLQTDRLALRTWTEADVGDALRLFGDAEVMRYVPSPPLASLEEAEQHVREAMAYQEEHGFCFWAMVERESGAFVGDCGLKVLEEGPNIELGYHVLRERWGRGLATEAARGVLEYALGHLQLPRVVAVALPENRASRRVMEKSGMRFAGQRRCYGADCVLYEATQEGWNANDVR